MDSWLVTVNILSEAWVEIKQHSNTAFLSTALDMIAEKVLYCGVCSMPPEFCEFSGTQEKCKTWLQKNHPAEFSKIYEDAGIEKGVEGIKLEEKPAEEKKDRSQVKDKSAQLEAKLEKENQKKMQSHVIIKRVERTKRKCVTTIHGLEVFDVDLKKAAKMFANRFACGSSVAKNNQNQDEIVVQGDFSDELLDLILGNWPHIPEDNIDLVEDKKKK